MLGLEKRIDAVRQMAGVEPENPENRTPEEAKNTDGGPGSTAVVLAFVAMIAALAVYFALDTRYTSRLDAMASAYESRLAAMEEKIDAPREMARKIILTNSLAEVSQKVEQLKGLVPATQQEKLNKIDELVKAIQQETK